MLSTRHLGTAKAPWVVRSSCNPEILRMIVQREFPGVLVATISGKSCRTKRGLLRKLAEVLQFPDYFGRNWDALHVCITDLAWLRAAGYVIIVSNAEALLTKEEKDYKTFINLMRQAGQEWARATRPS